MVATNFRETRKKKMEDSLEGLNYRPVVHGTGNTARVPREKSDLSLRVHTVPR